MEEGFEYSGTEFLLSFGGDKPLNLVPSEKANQDKPKRFYVYGHYDKDGVPFYIGKGTKGRAWDKDRHRLWHRYVENHLQGEYEVVILEDDLTSEEAEELENLWVAQEGATLVNWVNFGRETDFEAIDQFHQLRDSNRDLALRAQGLEKENKDKAIAVYSEAIARISSYANIQFEKGILGKLLDEEIREKGLKGDVNILDRYTIFLMRAGEYQRLINSVEAYFSEYRGDLEFKATERCFKRIERAKLKLKK